MATVSGRSTGATIGSIAQMPEAPQTVNRPGVARPHRYEELDALRGLASLCVVCAHVVTLWGAPYAPWFQRLLSTPLRLLIAGPLAVILFFVMSGFVLMIPYRGPHKGNRYRSYLVKRVCRIYLPYLAALLVTAAADLAWARPVPGVLPFDGGWLIPFRWHVFFQHVLFLGNYPSAEINLAFWSLIQEMRISIIYPVVAFLALRMSLLGGIVISFLLRFVLTEAFIHTQSPWVQTLNWATCFLLGAVIAFHVDEVLAVLERIGQVGRIALLALSIGLYAASQHLPNGMRRTTLIEAMYIASVTLLMTLALGSHTVRRVLQIGAVRWLGRVSYSLYLLHGAVLYSMICLFWQRMDHRLLFATAVTLSLLLAEVFYRLVEVPSMRLGQRLSKRLRSAVKREGEPTISGTVARPV